MKELGRRTGSGTSLVAILTLLIACSPSTGGSPKEYPSASSKSLPAAVFPERPASLSTGAIDPCTLVPEGDRAALEIDRPPLPDQTPPDAPFTGASCSWSGTEWGNFLVILTEDFSAQDYLEQVGEGTELVEVDGFGAVLNPDSDIPPICHLAVDASNGGMALMSVNDRRIETVEDQGQACARVQQFASVVLTTLQAQQ